jgi:glutamine synthetase
VTDSEGDAVTAQPTTAGPAPTAATRDPRLADLAHAADVEFILALFVDLTGKPCAKLVPAASADELQDDGVGFAGYAVGAIGQQPHDPDLVVVPDVASFTPLPWVRPNLALVHCDPHVEGRPWPYAPRVVLRSVLEAPRSSTSSSTATPTGRCARPTPATTPTGPATTPGA